MAHPTRGPESPARQQYGTVATSSRWRAPVPSGASVGDLGESSWATTGRPSSALRRFGHAHQFAVEHGPRDVRGGSLTSRALARHRLSPRARPRGCQARKSEMKSLDETKPMTARAGKESQQAEREVVRWVRAAGAAQR